MSGGFDYLTPVEIAEGKTRHWRLGPLDLWLTRTSGEWQIETRRQAGEENALAVDEQPPPGREMRRWLTSRPGGRARLQPITPDLPLIVRPEMPLEIGSGAEALVYVLLPCWVRVIVGDEPGETLTELPSVALSKSWFGDPTEGEMCYGMRTTARRSLAAVGPRPHRAVCPVRLCNDFTRHLGFERLCLRTGPLSIFRAGDRLWTNTVTLRQTGDEQRGEITFGEGAPAEAGEATLITGPRTPRGSWLSSMRLRNLASFIR